MIGKTLLEINLDLDSGRLCEKKNQITLSLEKLYNNDENLKKSIDNLLNDFNQNNEIKITIGDVLNKDVSSNKIELVNNFLDKILANFYIGIKLNNGVSLSIEGEINNIQQAIITIIGKNKSDIINLLNLSESIKVVLIELKENVEKLLNKKISESINYEEIEKFIDKLSHSMQKKFLKTLYEQASKIPALSREMGNYVEFGQLKNIILLYNKLNINESKKLAANLGYVMKNSQTQKLHIETIRCIIELFKNHIDLLDNLDLKENFNTPVIIHEKPETTEEIVVENIKLTDYVLCFNAAIKGSLKKAVRDELLDDSDLAQYEVREEDFTLSNGNDFLTREDIRDHMKKIQSIKVDFNTDIINKNLKERWKNAKSIIDPIIFFNLYLQISDKTK